MPAHSVTRGSTLPIPAPAITLDAAVMAEIEAARASGDLGTGYRTEPRCYVCCEAESKDLVNKLISAGLTNREIVECCASINVRRQDADDDRVINARSVWEHKRKHFNVDEPARALFREIMERRAEEQHRDHINGVGHAVTPYGVLETAMVKGYQSLTGDALVSVKEMMEAATKLHELTNADAGQRRMADLLSQMDRIIAVVTRVVPEEYHEAILAGLEGKEVPTTPTQAITDKVHELEHQAIREFTPPTRIDAEDEI